MFWELEVVWYSWRIEFERGGSEVIEVRIGVGYGW